MNVRAISLVVAGVLAAACGSSTTADPTLPSTAPEATSATSAPAADPSPDQPLDPTDGRSAGIGIAPSDLGEVLVDGDGQTLYLLVSDQRGDSTCNDTCQNAWVPLPPELVGAVPEPLDLADFGSAVGPDGLSRQATYRGWPLYTYELEAPGELTGHGLLDSFFGISPLGEAIGITE